MNTRKFPMAVCTLLLLAACKTTVVTEEERKLPMADKEPVMEDDKKMDDKEMMDEDVQTSYIAFKGAVANVKSHEGQFTRFDFKMMPDETDPMDYEKADVMVTVDIESMTTDSNGLTKHLLNPDFFDVAEYPTASFESTSIAQVDGDDYTVEGDLTIKDVTKSVTFDAEITSAHFYTTFVIDRTEFNVDSDAITDKAIDEEVPLEIKIVFPKSN